MPVRVMMVIFSLRPVPEALLLYVRLLAFVFVFFCSSLVALTRAPDDLDMEIGLGLEFEAEEDEAAGRM